MSPDTRLRNVSYEQQSNASALFQNPPVLMAPETGQPLGYEELHRVFRVIDLEKLSPELYTTNANKGILVVESLPANDNPASLFDLGAHPGSAQDDFIEGRLPCPPLEVRTVKMRFRFTGQGRPSFRLVTEIDPYSDR